MHTPSLHRYVGCLDAGDLEGVAALMLESAHKLARCGADFLVCPDNTIHQAYARMAPRSPLPWLHIAEVVAGEAQRRGFRKLGLTGTRYLVDSNVYPDKLTGRGLDYVRPAASARVLHRHKRLHGPERAHHEGVRNVAADQMAGGAEVISAKDNQRRVLRRVVDAQGGREVHLALSAADADGRVDAMGRGERTGTIVAGQNRRGAPCQS